MHLPKNVLFKVENFVLFLKIFLLKFKLKKEQNVFLIATADDMKSRIYRTLNLFKAEICQIFLKTLILKANLKKVQKRNC